MAPCKVVLDAESRQTRLLLAAGVPLTPGARSALMFRHKDCAVYQAVSVVGRASPGGVKVRMPLDAVLSLAELAGSRGGSLYDYAVKIKGPSLPTAELVYEGYVPYSLYAVARGKAFAVMRKAGRAVRPLLRRVPQLANRPTEVLQVREGGQTGWRRLRHVLRPPGHDSIPKRVGRLRAGRRGRLRVCKGLDALLYPALSAYVDLPSKSAGASLL